MVVPPLVLPLAVLPLPVVPLLAVPLPLVPLPVVPLPVVVLPPDAVLPEPVEPVLAPAAGLLVLPEPVVPELAPLPVLGEVADEPEPEVPEPLVPLPDEVWATDSPPMARAAAAARVVRVFLVVIMSYSLIGNPEGNRLKKAGAKPAVSETTFPSGR